MKKKDISSKKNTFSENKVLNVQRKIFMLNDTPFLEGHSTTIFSAMFY